MAMPRDDEERSQRQTQVADWMDRLRVGLQRADEVHKQLEDRLAPVLRDDQPVSEQAANVKENEEPLVVLATEVRTFVWKLDYLSDQYQGILNRLEL